MLGDTMAENVEVLTVFLASPGDVAAERAQAREVIDELNRTVGHEKRVRLEVVGWETHAYPSYGADGQAIINAQIADMTNCDLFVGIMWNRFGMSTARAESGTEEEFNRAEAAFRRSQVDAPIALDSKSDSPHTSTRGRAPVNRAHSGDPGHVLMGICQHLSIALKHAALQSSKGGILFGASRHDLNNDRSVIMLIHRIGLVEAFA
jgi:hypothetical protein